MRAGALDADEFGTRFGQTAAAIYAKGVEDTAFYRHARLLSLNEVGGDPGRFGVRLEEFHRFAATLQAATPTAMTTSSTHDTKRSEDVRARLAVLSNCPTSGIARFVAGSRRHWPWGAPTRSLVTCSFRRSSACGHGVSSEPPPTWRRPPVRPRSRPRGQNPMRPMTKRYVTFVGRVFDDHDLLAEVGLFVAALEPFGRSNSLAQKLIQLTMPGVPDTYQGCELDMFHLVDPDNRGPVDFGIRQAALPLLADAKLRLDRHLAQVAARPPALVRRLHAHDVRGPAADHLVAFARSSRSSRWPRACRPGCIARAVGATRRSICPPACGSMP